MAPDRMLPHVGDVNRPFWTGGHEGGLLIGRCAACERWVHPPQESCPGCGGVLSPEPVSGDGTVWSFTVNHHPFNPRLPVPYVIALVELVEQENLRLPTNIVDCDPAEVDIGLRVHVVFDDQGDVSVPVFRPA